MPRITVRASAALLFLVATAELGPALAQNYDGTHQVRVGAFLATGPVSMDLTATPIFGPATSASSSNNLFGVGISAGLEWLRRGQWSWGFEGDWAATSGNRALAGTEVSIDYLATLRARAGFYARPDLLVYGTAGIGFLATEVKAGSLKEPKTSTGLALGVGLEWDRGPWILSADYLSVSFREQSVTIGTTQYNYDADVHSFRLGVKFKVGHDHYHDDVRERLGK